MSDEFRTRILEMNERVLSRFQAMEYAVQIMKLVEPDPYDKLLDILEMETEVERIEAIRNLCQEIGLPPWFCSCLIKSIIERCPKDPTGKPGW
jgi:hypothetical protein